MKRNATTKRPAKSAKPRVVTVDEFRKLRGPLKERTLIFFNPKQRAALTRGIPLGTGSPPRRRARLVVVDVPGLGGLVEPICPVGESHPITGADGEMRCGNPPGLGGSGGPLKPFDTCTLGVDRNGAAYCAGTCGLSGKRCKPSRWMVKFGSGRFRLRFIVVACACRWRRPRPRRATALAR